MKFIPHKYQEIAIRKILENQSTGLFLDMGLGKTVITLTAINQLCYRDFEVGKVLIIAPLRVAEDTWTREAEKWDHLKNLRFSQILGPEKKRIAGLMTKADVYIINCENVVWLVKYLRKIKMKWPFDMLVVDELSKFKNNQSKRFKALRKVLEWIEKIVGLTGTPAPNGLIDLWAQVFLLDQGQRLGWTIGEYRSRYFWPGSKNGHIVYDWVLKEGAEDQIHEALSDLCISMKAEDWLDLPDRIDVTVPVTLPATAKEAYKKLERDLILSIDDSNIVAQTAAVLSNKLLQCANGTIYDDEKRPQVIHKAKIEALEKIIERSSDQPILVFYAYKHDQEALLRSFPEAKQLEGSDDIKAWNEGKIALLIAHPGSAGHGLNLQAGGSIIVWYGMTWSLEHYQQANARLHRQGQTERVIIHHLITEGTMDEVVMDALTRKAKGQDALLEAVKAKIEEYGRD